MFQTFSPYARERRVAALSLSGGDGREDDRGDRDPCHG
jgi:hypothetical protein